jgi:hypothetical protein
MIFLTGGCFCFVFVSFYSINNNNDEKKIKGKYQGKGAFLLCKTSNPGSQDILTLPLQATTQRHKNKSKENDSTRENKNENDSCHVLLYEHIASLVSKDWSQRGPSSTSLLGLVVGATDPEAIRRVRMICDDSDDTDQKNSNTNNSNSMIWLLTPGVGIQGGSLQETIQAGINPTNGYGLLLPMSRSISQATNMKQTVNDLHEQIQSIRSTIMKEYQERKQESQQQQQQVETTTTPSTTTLSSSSSSSSTLTTLQPYQRELIDFCIQQDVLKFGTFTLKSGRISPYFFNAGLFDTGAALYTLATAYASTIIATVSNL